MEQKKKKERRMYVKETLRVKSGLLAGYWKCTGVSGPLDRKGRISPAYAAYCSK